MKSNVLILLVFALSAISGFAQQRKNYAVGPWGRIDSVSTELSPAKCKPAAEKGFRICNGIPGYQLLYAGSKSGPQIIVVTPDGKRHPLEYWDVKSPDFVSVENRVSWHIARSGRRITPLALVLWVNEKDDEYTRMRGTVTVIAKITPKEICVVGRVRPSSTSAMTVAGIEGTAPNRECWALSNTGKRDWLAVVFGLVHKGHYEEAKSMIKELKSPGERTTAYGNIAEGQAEAGDVSGARTTLLQGLVEVQRKQTSYQDEFGQTVNEGDVYGINLMAIISSMARAGLYDDARATIKFLEPEDVIHALVTIARIQGDSPIRGGRSDREAARQTFREAIEIARKNPDAEKADGQLIEIVDRQAEVGLIEDARQTESLIKGASARQVANGKIAWYSDKPQ